MSLERIDELARQEEEKANLFVSLMANLHDWSYWDYSTLLEEVEA
jgi:hypothetical protein